EEPGAPADAGALQAYAAALMDRDSKSPGLKVLQGLIWERGYREGVLRGDVFGDVPRALQRWSEHGLALAVYSSGSELAQRLLFRSTQFGDLTLHFTHFFDTRVGAKRQPESYRNIARAMARPAAQLLFISDVVAELDAARASGWATILCVRPGNAVQSPGDHD